MVHGVCTWGWVQGGKNYNEVSVLLRATLLKKKILP